MNSIVYHEIKNFLKLFCLISLSMVPVLSVAEDQKSDLLTTLKMKGELIQGSAVIGKLPENSELYVNNQLIKSTSSGNFFLGFDRDEQLEQTLLLKTAEGKQISDTITLKKREYSLQKVNGVPQKTVSPSKESLKRIREENALVSQARAAITEHAFFLEKFTAPMNGPITGVYGSQRIYNGVPKRPHYGVDYAGPVGALVYAPASGVVTLTHSDMFYSGGTLIIDHGFGLSSSFLHLSEILVKEGQDIKQGEAIAKVGKGGRASGPHLDWRMNWLDVRIDPLKVIGIYKDNP
jgi:murein DD-endopeptidase MepM/ murein hydrolase activator NlpD